MSIGLFVDGEFVRRTYRGQIDYLKLRQAVESELADTIDEAYYFNADDDPPRSQSLYAFLKFPPPRGPGFRVKIYWLSRKALHWPHNLGGKPVLHPDDESIQYEVVQQKGVDVGLAFHMMRSFHQRRWTKLALCAGDGDFSEPVQTLVEMDGVEAYLFGSAIRTSKVLGQYAKRVFDIDEEPLLTQLRRDPRPSAPAVVSTTPSRPPQAQPAAASVVTSTPAVTPAMPKAKAHARPHATRTAVRKSKAKSKTKPKAKTKTPTKKRK